MGLMASSTGTGKSTLATLYASAAAQSGKRSAIFLFDEDEESFLIRAKGLGMDLSPQIDSGLIRLRRISVGEISPGEFAQTLRRAVDEEDVKLLVIDSLTGYYIVMPEEKLLLAQMHELIGYLNKRGVLTGVPVYEGKKEGLMKGEM